MNTKPSDTANASPDHKTRTILEFVKAKALGECDDPLTEKVAVGKTIKRQKKVNFKKDCDNPSSEKVVGGKTRKKPKSRRKMVNFEENCNDPLSEKVLVAKTKERQKKVNFKKDCGITSSEEVVVGKTRKKNKSKRKMVHFEEDCNDPLSEKVVVANTKEKPKVPDDPSPKKVVIAKTKKKLKPREEMVHFEEDCNDHLSEKVANTKKKPKSRQKRVNFEKDPSPKEVVIAKTKKKLKAREKIVKLEEDCDDPLSEKVVSEDEAKKLTKRIATRIRCNVIGCDRAKVRGRISHRFPKSAKIVEEWLKVCNANSNIATARICSIHFTDKCYERDLMSELLGLPIKKRLKADALPTLCLSEATTEVHEGMPKEADEAPFQCEPGATNKIHGKRLNVADATPYSHLPGAITDGRKKRKTVHISRIEDELDANDYFDDFDDDCELSTLTDIEAPEEELCKQPRIHEFGEIHLNPIVVLDKRFSRISFLGTIKGPLLKKFEGVKKYQVANLERTVRELEAKKRTLISENSGLKKQLLEAKTKIVDYERRLGSCLTKTQCQRIFNTGEAASWQDVDMIKVLPLFAHSQDAYSVVEDYWGLPVPSMEELKTWIQDVFNYPTHFICDIFQLMTKAVNTNLSPDKVCVFEIEEMYHPKKDGCIGTLKGILKLWEQPVMAPKDKTRDKNAVMATIRGLEAYGYKVVAVFDNFRVRKSLWSEVTDGFTKLYFLNPADETRKVWLLNCQSYVIENLRRIFLSNSNVSVFAKYCKNNESCSNIENRM